MVTGTIHLFTSKSSTQYYWHIADLYSSDVNAYVNVFKIVCMKRKTDSCLYTSEFFCLLLGPPGFNCWFSFAPVFQWCCSTPQGSPGVGRNTFLSSPHLCFIIVFICDLFVSRDDPLIRKKTFTRTEQLYVLSHDRS